MSFYNVQNPTSFSIVSDVRKSTVQSGKLIRFPATQIFTATGDLTAEQLIAGNVILNSGSNATLTLPSATALITLLMGPGGFDVSSSDIFSFEAFSIGSGTLTIAVNSSGGSGSNKSISSGAQKTINLQISITVSAGVTSYSYTML
jgi:hypothetical protein